MLVEHIDSAVCTVWTVVCGSELERAPVEPGAVSGVTGFVTLDGAFNGAVMVQCSTELAQTLTAAMFGSPEAAPDRADVRDAVGELTNMIAGNLKPLLPGPSGIGLPVVAFGADHDVQILRAEPVGVVGFVSGGQPLLVTIVRRADPPEERADPPEEVEP